MNNLLSSLIEKYGSDKNISDYTELYDFIFRGKGKESVTSFLEIGVGSLNPEVQSSFVGNLRFFSDYIQGNSLRAYRDYFINSQIYGIDIAEDCRIKENRIETFIFDSTNTSFCEKHLKHLSFDVIIDDGLHTAIGQLKTLENLFKRVRYDGFYIVEDLGGGGDSMNMFVDFKKEVENIVKDHQYYFRGNVLIIKKDYSKKGQIVRPEDFFNTDKKNSLTIVSGLWNINRSDRSFNHYLMCFEKFLEIDQNMFLFVPKELESFVWERRSRINTEIKIFELSDIKNIFNPFWKQVSNIRLSSDWKDQSGWLLESPQGLLECYNPIVMSKMFMLHDASIYDTFKSENFIWLDAGITNTVNYDLLTKSDFFYKIHKYLDPFLFITYPYPYYGKGVKEIHGFDWEALNMYADGVVDWIGRGGLFGGKKDAISDANSYYWHMLNDTLAKGYMGTEESIFSILAKKYPEFFRSSKININGHIQEFVKKVIEDTAELEEIPKNRIVYKKNIADIKNIKMSLYMLTFNFPHQVEHTIQKWLKHPKWIKDTRNILIDNSTNDEARIANAEICKKYNFEHIITNDNTGINGGRFRAAQHFDQSDSDYYIFLEDDMGIHPPEINEYCRNGFRKCVPDLYDKAIKIMASSDIDFLKLSFTEVYMDNNIQVSWYNVPQITRSEFWPDYDKLPTTGLDPNCPRTEFDKIDNIDGLSYATGDIYYCNWPTIMGKEGNRKVFLDTTWARPYEQTWMSYVFQETKKGNIKPAVLLASPIDHDRIAHYKPEERREN